MVTKTTKSKKKLKKNVVTGTAHISSTFNNTIITITDTTGNTISWSSSGNKGFPLLIHDQPLSCAPLAKFLRAFE